MDQHKTDSTFIDILRNSYRAMKIQEMLRVYVYPCNLYVAQSITLKSDAWKHSKNFRKLLWNYEIKRIFIQDNKLFASVQFILSEIPNDSITVTHSDFKTIEQDYRHVKSFQIVTLQSINTWFQMISSNDFNESNNSSFFISTVSIDDLGSQNQDRDNVTLTFVFHVQ